MGVFFKADLMVLISKGSFNQDVEQIEKIWNDVLSKIVEILDKKVSQK